MVTKDKTVFLIDWGCAENRVVPHYDIMGMEVQHENELKAFTEGYGLTELEFINIEKEITTMKLIQAFDLTRWAIDRAPSRTKFYAESACFSRIKYFCQDQHSI